MYDYGATLIYNPHSTFKRNELIPGDKRVEGKGVR